MLNGSITDFEGSDNDSVNECMAGVRSNTCAFLRLCKSSVLWWYLD